MVDTVKYDHNGVIKDCELIWGVFKVCVGDTIEIYPRAGRSLMKITGRVKAIGDSALILETDTNNIAIRYSEIKMLRKLH